MCDRNRLMDVLKKIEYTPFPEMTMKSNLANQFTDYALNYIVDELLVNGVIVPPCKVGDWVWYIRNDKVNKAKIEEERYSASKHGYFSDSWLFFGYDFKNKFEIDFYLDDIGETVFLTKEEAEAKLKELSDNA